MRWARLSRPSLLRLRMTEEPLEIVAILDASGTMLVRDVDGREFEATRDDVETSAERHGVCGCCE